MQSYTPPPAHVRSGAFGSGADPVFFNPRAPTPVGGRREAPPEARSSPSVPSGRPPDDPTSLPPPERPFSRRDSIAQQRPQQHVDGSLTYLESFLDSITSLPLEVRRNLRLIQDLDYACAEFTTELDTAQTRYVRKVRRKVLEFGGERTAAPPRRADNTKGGRADAEGAGPRMKGGSAAGGGGDASEKKNSTPEGVVGVAAAENSAAERTPVSVESGGGGTNKRKRDDIDASPSLDALNKNDGPSPHLPLSSLSAETSEKSGGGIVPEPNMLAGVPTTEELRAIVEDPDELQKINNLRASAYQVTDEKNSIISQTSDLIEAALSRIDSDISRLESYLKSTGGFTNIPPLPSGMGGAKGSTTGGNASGGSAAANQQGGAGSAASHPPSGAAGSSPAAPTPAPARVDDLAAIQETAGADDWILAKVLSHVPETGIYRLSDEDADSNKVFQLPRDRVVPLTGDLRLVRGDSVYAVYPDTTSFYPATVVQASRRVVPNLLVGVGGNVVNSSLGGANVLGSNAGGGGAAGGASGAAGSRPGDNMFIMVHFVDDSDENGITHDKFVLMKHVMRPPKGSPTS